MRKNSYSFEVGKLVNADHGTRISLDLDESEPILFNGKPLFKPPLSAKVTFMKIDDAIHVNLENIFLKAHVECSRCIAPFLYKLEISQAERVYYFKKQKGIEMDNVDTFYVDMKRLVIDLTEFLRQEIILHFPPVPVCLKSCKGLCFKCGSNLNKGKCKCKDSKAENKPLSALKDLYNKL